MPDPVKRERVRANVMEGVNSRYFRDAVLRFDRLLGRMEQALSADPWLAGAAYSLADVAYTPYATRLDHLQLRALWDHRPHFAAWYDRIKQRDSYQVAMVKWFNPKYLSLMEEKGRQEWPRVKAIVG